MHRDNLTAAHAQIDSMRTEIKRLGDENQLLETENNQLRQQKKPERAARPVPMGSVIWLLILTACMMFDIYQVVIGHGWWLTYVAIGIVGVGMFIHAAAIVRRE
ncbi:MAG: hypothetical protein ACWGQW_01555 [bacterium]